MVFFIEGVIGACVYDLDKPFILNGDRGLLDSSSAARNCVHSNIMRQSGPTMIITMINLYIRTEIASWANTDQYREIDIDNQLVLH